MSDDRNDDDSVGYGRPPKHAQFEKGKSGNPAGRPKGKSTNKQSKTHLEALAKAFGKVVEMNEGGKRKKFSKAELVWERVINDAIGGKPYAVKLAMAAIEKSARFNVPIDFETANSVTLVDYGAIVRQKLDAIRERMKAAGQILEEGSEKPKDKTGEST